MRIFPAAMFKRAMFKRYSLQLPIAMKAVLLIAALGLLSIAANWFCLQRLDEIDRLNAVVTRHFAPTRLALAEADAVHQQNFVARKIAKSVEHASTRTVQVSDSIAGVSEMVQRSGQGADQLLAAAAELNRQAAALSRDANAFVGRVRAA
jgi:hypothetical protein